MTKALARLLPWVAGLIVLAILLTPILGPVIAGWYRIMAALGGVTP